MITPKMPFNAISFKILVYIIIYIYVICFGDELFFIKLKIKFMDGWQQRGAETQPGTMSG